MRRTVAAVCGALLISAGAIGARPVAPPMVQNPTGNPAPLPPPPKAPAITPMQERAVLYRNRLNLGSPPELSAPISLTPMRALIPGLAKLEVYDSYQTRTEGSLSDPSDQGTILFCGEVCSPFRGAQVVVISLMAVENRRYVFDCRISGRWKMNFSVDNVSFGPTVTASRGADADALVGDDGHAIWATGAVQSSGLMIVDMQPSAGNTTGAWTLWGCEISSY